jgi:HAMP domain-containing protein
MKLAQKLILYALAVALVPLAATGFTLIRVGEGALRERIEEHQRAAAVAIAAKVSESVEEMARRLGVLMMMVDVPTLTRDEREGLARLLYRQADGVRLVILKRHDGVMLTRPTFLGEAELRGTDLAGHPAATAADVATLERHLPEVDFSRYRAGTILMSPVYYEVGSSARVAVSVTCCEGLDGLARAIAGVEVSLREELLRVEGVETGPQSSVFLVDGNGTVIIHPSLASGTRLAEHGAVAAFLDKRIERTAVYTTPKGRYAAAFAPVGALGWGVVVEQPEAVAYAAANRMRRQILLYSAVTIALVLLTGLLFAGRLRRVLARMMEGARAFGEGRLGRRIDVRSSDEIGELAGTMNAMA